jgi:hypothetical protein
MESRARLQSLALVFLLAEQPRLSTTSSQLPSPNPIDHIHHALKSSNPPRYQGVSSLTWYRPKSGRQYANQILRCPCGSRFETAEGSLWPRWYLRYCSGMLPGHRFCQLRWRKPIFTSTEVEGWNEQPANSTRNSTQQQQSHPPSTAPPEPSKR